MKSRFYRHTLLVLAALILPSASGFSTETPTAGQDHDSSDSGTTMRQSQFMGKIVIRTQ